MQVVRGDSVAWSHGKSHGHIGMNLPPPTLWRGTSCVSGSFSLPSRTNAATCHPPAPHLALPSTRQNNQRQHRNLHSHRPDPESCDWHRWYRLPSSVSAAEHLSQLWPLCFRVLGYLAHKKTPTLLGTPYDPRHGPTVGS